jgi:hypothetical protein
MKTICCNSELYFKISHFEVVFPIFLILLFSRCASSYQSMSLGLLEYTQGDSIKDISYGYHFNALRDFGNTKYAEKGMQNNISLVAFNFENLSNRRINLANDLEYYQEQTTIINPKEPISIYNSFALSPNKYLADLSLIVVNAYWMESFGSSLNTISHLRMIPIGIFIGPMLTLYNFSKVKKSNIMFGKDLDKYSPFTSIEPGGKKYVLIPFEDIGKGPIQIRVKGSNKLKSN